MNGLNYEERLRRLKLPSLEFRRKRGDMIETYKYLHKKYNTNKPELVKSEVSITRGNSLKLEIPRREIKVRSNFFTKRVCELWNSLPNRVVTAPSVNAFKNRLQQLHRKCLESPFFPCNWQKIWEVIK